MATVSSLSNIAQLHPAFSKRITQLNQASVTKFFNAYLDIDWDNPDNQIDICDERWILTDQDFLGATQWYQSLTKEQQSKLGLQRAVDSMKLGAQFENILNRGMLAFAANLPDHAPEFRYAMHEVHEEVQHSLMFQEFINRSGLQPAPIHPFARWSQKRIIHYGESFPELFMFFVLGGEAPIDHVQREILRKEQVRHPLILRIMEIHTLEEARHIDFAKHFLQDRVPKLSSFKKQYLKIAVPVIFYIMASMMIKPSSHTVHKYNIPQEVLTSAFHQNPAYREMVINSFAKVIKLCKELGLTEGNTQFLWRKLITI